MRTSKHSHNQQYTTVELGQWQDVLNGGLYHITRGRKLLTKPCLTLPCLRAIGKGKKANIAPVNVQKKP